MKMNQLNSPILGFDKKPIIVKAPEGKEPEQFMFKVALLNCLGSKKPSDGKESIAIYRLGTKIYDTNKEVSLDISELQLLKAAVGENAPGYTGMIQGQLLLMLESVEKN